MDLLIVAGVLAVVGLVVIGALAVLQHRREGTVKAVAAPRRSLSRVSGDADDQIGDADAGAADAGSR